MAVQRLTIGEFLKGKAGHTVFDVRSPGEYKHAHLPGSKNLPLFSDDERKQVGTAYKQVSREQAIKIGLEYFGPRMKSMVETVEGQVGTDKSIYLYCWRGGMRSAAVAWLLDLYGFQVHTLAGGYKAFRNWVIDTYSRPYPLNVLGGYSGSGKTALLKQLDKGGEKVIHLEELANHKGSAFGNIGQPAQPSQEMFENLLSVELLKLDAGFRPKNDCLEALEINNADQNRIWIEDESQRIGLVNIPGVFWQNMRAAPVYFLEIPFEERLDQIVVEYGAYDKERLLGAVERLGKGLGGLNARIVCEFIANGALKDAFRILLEYYDKKYFKGLHNRDGLSSLLNRVVCDRVSDRNAQLLTKYQPV